MYGAKESESSARPFGRTNNGAGEREGRTLQLGLQVARIDLLRALLKRRGLPLPDDQAQPLEPSMPTLLTPGAAEALSVNIYRQVRTGGLSIAEAVRESLQDYLNPVPLDVLETQIRLAAREASDLDFVPECFRTK